MILGQDILRLLTVKALMGRTWAGNRVFDSPAKPADLTIEQERAAFLGIYTDEADHDLDGQSFFNPDATVYLLIECATADRITIPGQPDGNAPTTPPAGNTTITLAQTDKALELVIGCLARQVVQALMATDEGNPWAELWRLYTTPGRNRVEVRRGGPGQDAAQSAIRYASRIMRMSLKVLGEPSYGEDMTKAKYEFWRQFFAVAETDTEDLAHLVPILKSHFETTPGVLSWRVEQARGTYTQPGTHSLGITPVEERLREGWSAFKRSGPLRGR